MDRHSYFFSSCLCSFSGPIYHLDEVSALVFDIGSSLAKVGYAGEDAPKSVFPTHAGVVDGESMMDIDSSSSSSSFSKKYRFGDHQIYKWRQGMDVVNPFLHGAGQSVSLRREMTCHTD